MANSSQHLDRYKWLTRWAAKSYFVMWSCHWTASGALQPPSGRRKPLSECQHRLQSNRAATLKWSHEEDICYDKRRFCTVLKGLTIHHLSRLIRHTRSRQGWAQASCQRATGGIHPRQVASSSWQGWHTESTTHTVDPTCMLLTCGRTGT